MATERNIFQDFEYGINKIGFFIHDILRQEQLSADAETQREECLSQLQFMSNTLCMLKNYPTYSNVSPLHAGLSQSSQELNHEDEFGLSDIPRSGSLPDIPGTGASGSSKTRENTVEMDSDFSLKDMRELVIYDPIEEEEEDNDEDGDGDDEDPLKLSTGSRSSIKRSRKRDSAVLFDISLGDLEDAIDLAGFLTEKHSGKEWYCVLMDQHLCMFPTRDPSEVAYDVMILPCCQISLDDRLMRTPVFRLTQAGMAPWVLVAKDNEELKEWINALTTAASGGKYSLSSNSSSTELRRATRGGSMQAISEELQEENEEILEEEDEEELDEEEIETKPTTNLESSSESTKTVKEEKLEQGKKEEIRESITQEDSVQPLENVPDTPTSPDTYGEDIYEAVQAQNDDFDDDGFATDEFDSASSENEDADSSPKGSPKLQPKAKKKNQLLNWLKKKTRTKDRLFSSPQDGVALAGYVHRLDNNECSKRWCVVREGKIYCYKNIKDEDTELTLELGGSEIRAKEEQKNRFVVRVMKDNERLLALLTKNTRDMDKWKTALRLESGFIKHTSPTDTSSGVFDDEEGDYITPITPIGLQTTPKTTSVTSESDSVYDAVANGDDENAYLTINPRESFGKLPGIPSGKKSPDPESLGPLPSIPSGKKSPDPESLGPPPSIPSGKKSPDSESLGPLPSIPKSMKSSDQESLGPLPPLPVDAKPPALPPPRRSPVPRVFEDEKQESGDSEESDEIYEEIRTVSLPDADKLSKYHKMNAIERREYEEQNKNIDIAILTSESAFRRPPPLVRKVSFDEKVHVIPTALQPKPELINGIHDDKSPAEKPQETHKSEKPQAEVNPIPKQPSDSEMRSLPRKTLKDNWVKANLESEENPKIQVITRGPKIEQDKEREILQKTEDEFVEMARALKEKGSAALKQKRPSIVERNRVAFENRKREEAMSESKILSKTQALNKEKADLLALIEFQKKRVAVAKDRKIFFSFSSTNNNTAVVDADMEFHESQLGLAKAKKRITEIENELKNIELLRFKSGREESVKNLPFKTKEFKLICDESKEVKAVDENDGSDTDHVRNLKRGNVLSKLKVFENMSGK